MDAYFEIHAQCGLICKGDPKRLFHGHIAQAKIIDMPHPQELIGQGARVYLDVQFFNPICNKALVLLRDTHHMDQEQSIVKYYNQSDTPIYRPKRIFIPYLQGRVKLELNCIDDNITGGIYHRVFEFQYNAIHADNQITFQYQDVIIWMKKQIMALDQLHQESGFQWSYAPEQVLEIICIKINNDNVHTKFVQQQSRVKHETFQLSPISVPMSSATKFQCLVLDENPFDWIEEMGNIELVRGNIIEFVKSQHGSRLIQKYFQTCTAKDLDILLVEIQPALSDLMVDSYANYIFGALSQACTPQQRMFILNTISINMIEIACDKKGTHSIQQLVGLVNCSQEEEIIAKAIDKQIIQLILDAQGTHFIRRIIAVFRDVTFIELPIMDRFVMIVNNQYGLCVIKDLLSRGDKLINKLQSHLEDIIQDPYGNYAVQVAITLHPDKCAYIFERIQTRLAQLSIHKFSSNVIEKCILETNQQIQKQFIRGLCQDNICVELMKNKFGTFVLQKALSVDDSKELVQCLNRNVHQIHAGSVRTRWLDFLRRR